MLTESIVERMRKRRQRGERVSVLARELRIPWQKLDKAIRNGLPVKRKPSTPSIRKRLGMLWERRTGRRPTPDILKEIIRQATRQDRTVSYRQAAMLLDLYVSDMRGRGRRRAKS